MLSFVCVALPLLVPSIAAASKGSWKYAVKESHPIPSKWSLVSAAPKSQVIKVDIGIKQGDFEKLENELYAVSDPDNSRYGQHLSLQDVQKLVRPSDESLDQVHEWLSEHGIDQNQITYSDAKDWLSIHVPVSTLEDMLQTKYGVFRNKHDGNLAVRTTNGAWHLPDHLHDHIDLISPTNAFFRPNAKHSSKKMVTFGGKASNLPTYDDIDLSSATVDAVCNDTDVNMLCLRKYYGTHDYVPKAAGKNKVGVSNYLGESTNRSDTSIFLNRYRPDAIKGAYDFKFESINGGPTYQKMNKTFTDEDIEMEGNLEAQTVIGITYPIPLTVFSTAGEPPFKPDSNNPTDGNEPYLTWLNHVLAQDDLPQSISNSYDDDEQSVPYSYAKRVCDGMAQLGARGISVFFPSGDSGVGPNGTCIANDGTNRTAFLPTFPPSCPYVTTVGGTMNFSPEIVGFDPPNNDSHSFAVGFSSGGGFSNYFKQPKYQSHVVNEYISDLKGEHNGLYNKHGRGYPDIAAHGAHVVAVWNDTEIHIDGTKCAISTAVFSLVNDALIAKGKPPMGFLNPWLYKKGFVAMNDVTQGSSIGCDTNGFPAKKGWDAATGFGSPMFKKILELI